MPETIEQRLNATRNIQCTVQCVVDTKGPIKGQDAIPKFGERWGKPVRKVAGITEVFYNDNVGGDAKWKKLDPDIDLGEVIRERDAFKKDNKELRSQLTRTKNRLASAGIVGQQEATA